MSYINGTAFLLVRIVVDSMRVAFSIFSIDNIVWDRDSFVDKMQLDRWSFAIKDYIIYDIDWLYFVNSAETNPINNKPLLCNPYKTGILKNWIN